MLSYEKALEYSDKSLEICQKLLQDGFNQQMVYQEIAIIYYSSGVIYYDMADFDRALVFLFQSYFILRKIFKSEDTLVMASCLHTIAEAKSYLRSFDEAADYFEKSLSIRMKISQHNGDLDQLNFLHEKAIHLNLDSNYEESIKYYRKVFNLIRSK